MAAILQLLVGLLPGLAKWLPALAAYGKGRIDGAAAAEAAGTARADKIIEAERRAESTAPQTGAAVSEVLRKGDF